MKSRAAARIATRLPEDRLRQERRDDPVRRVDDLADPEVRRDARDDVGLLAREPALRDQVVDQVADGLLGGQEEVGAVGRRRELRARGSGWGPAVRSWGSRSGRPWRSPTRSVTRADISTALMQTSPSPWAAWASPTDRSAPSTQTGR